MKKQNTEIPDLDVMRLLELKKYERPEKNRAEKHIQNIMREVRSVSNEPALLLLPERGMGWLFAQPRYGIAALFVLFLGLHLIDRPVPKEGVGTVSLEAPEPSASVMAAVGTNQAVRLPGVAADESLYPAFSGEAKPVLTSLTE